MDTDGTDDGVMIVQHAASVVLTCEGHAAPTPDITWMRDGVVLTNASNINIVTSTPADSRRNTISTLTVSVFTVSEEGNYTCTITNAVGSVVTGGLVLSENCCNYIIFICMCHTIAMNDEISIA